MPDLPNKKELLRFSIDNISDFSNRLKLSKMSQGPARYNSRASSLSDFGQIYCKNPEIGRFLSPPRRIKYVHIRLKIAQKSSQFGNFLATIPKSDRLLEFAMK